MTERTALFLASLSHRWFPIVALLPIVFGVANHCAGVLQARARARSNALALRASKMLRGAVCALLAMSIVVFGISFIHLGCASLNAHNMQCMSHIKQLALGDLIYAQDYDDHLPASVQWEDAIASRVKTEAGSNRTVDDDPFRCPAAESPASYGMNAALGGMSLSDMDAPVDTVLLFDADAPRHSFAGGSQDVAQERHSGAPNIAFADGHAGHANPFVFEKLNWAPKETPEQNRNGP